MYIHFFFQPRGRKDCIVVTNHKQWEGRHTHICQTGWQWFPQRGRLCQAHRCPTLWEQPGHFGEGLDTWLAAAATHSSCTGQYERERTGSSQCKKETWNVSFSRLPVKGFASVCYWSFVEPWRRTSGSGSQTYSLQELTQIRPQTQIVKLLAFFFSEDPLEYPQGSLVVPKPHFENNSISAYLGESLHSMSQRVKVFSHCISDSKLRLNDKNWDLTNKSQINKRISK